MTVFIGMLLGIAVLLAIVWDLPSWCPDCVSHAIGLGATIVIVCGAVSWGVVHVAYPKYWLPSSRPASVQTTEPEPTVDDRDNN